MHYEMTGVEATLSLKPVPTVYLKTKTLHGIHSYLASQFKDATSDFGITLDGILLAVILFILARVFRQGAAMREDLEGTV